MNLKTACVFGLAGLVPLASAGSNPIEDGLVYFEMTAFADVDQTPANGQYFVVQIVDPIFVPIGETVIVPGASPGINSFELSSSIETNGTTREIQFEMRTVDALVNNCFLVFNCGPGGNYIDWPGVPSSNRWWGHTYTMGIDAVDVTQGAEGNFEFFQIKYNPFGSPNTLRRLSISDWSVGNDLQFGPSSSYRPASGSGPYSNGSEGNTHGYRFVLTYPVAEGEPCTLVDTAAPFGLLDLADINRFVDGFINNGEIADLNRDDLYDLADISLFVDGFVNGCL